MNKLKLTAITFITVSFLTACAPQRAADVSITPEDEIKYTQELEKWAQKIEDYKPTEEMPDKRPPMDYFVEKARYEGYLGYRKQAIKTLEKALKKYPISSVGWNNIAKLYEKEGEYAKANEYYHKLIDTFPDMHANVLNMVENLIKLGDKENALRTYQQYTIKYARFDEELEEKIKKME